MKKLKTYKNIKYNLDRIRIAETLDIKDIVVSPYADLRDNMLAQQDIVKKFSDIKIFIDKFCQEPFYSVTSTEADNAWYYCVDSGVKLLPTFFNHLADGFHTDRYNEVLETIKAERGQLSDDGDRWIDKFSGYYICNIDYDTNEGYSSTGAKLISRDILELNAAERLLNMKQTQSNVKQKGFDYDNELSQKLKKILVTLDTYLHIKTDSEHDFVIKVTNDALNRFMLPEKRYRELVKNARAAGKKKKNYEKAHDEILMYSLISAYIISVQIIIPNIISTKTFPTCKKSFSGFPLDGNSDLSFLEYISCVLFDIRIDDRPWNVIPIALTGKKKRKKKYNEVKDRFVTKLKSFITDKILTIDYINLKLDTKREWIKKQKTGKIIPSEFNVQNWVSFLPPLEPVSVTRLENIGHQFIQMITRRFKEGDFQQFPHLWILYGKIMSFSFSILEAVQRAIDKEPLILVTNTNIPFLENACCNEGNPNTNEYFSDKESSIQKHNKIIYTLTELYYRFKNSIKSALLNIDKNTKITFPPVNNTFSTSTVYLAFIKFCKFNSGIILDEDLQSVCIRNNCDFRIPVSDDFNEQLSEKIETMRSNGLTYSVESLNILLNIINRKNIIPIDLDPPVITEKLFLERTLEYLETKADTFICPSDMIKHLKNIVDRFDVSISPKEEDTIFEDFERYLNRINDEQSKIMVEQLVETGIINKKLQDIIILYTHKSKISKSRQSKFILNWNPRGDNMYMTQNDETGFSIFRFLKQMVINICKIYPNIILNEVKYKD